MGTTPRLHCARLCVASGRLLLRVPRAPGASRRDTRPGWESCLEETHLFTLARKPKLVAHSHPVPLLCSLLVFSGSFHLTH